MAHTLLLVGGGKMGGALVRGWTAGGLAPASITVIDPDAAAGERLARETGVQVMAEPEALGADAAPEAVVLAVKPQKLDEILPAYGRFAGKALFVSIAAGKTLESLHRGLGPGAAAVRAMPNTPAAVGRGMTVAVAGAGVGAQARALAEKLLSAVGEVAWLDDEALMDAATAVSGCGPAYVFLLTECLARAGERAGLAGELSARLATATVAGAGELLARAEEPPERLRHNVTSPGGATAAALEELMGEPGLAELLERAVAAGARRARELAG